MPPQMPPIPQADLPPPPPPPMQTAPEATPPAQSAPVDPYATGQDERAKLQAAQELNNALYNAALFGNGVRCQVIAPGIGDLLAGNLIDSYRNQRAADLESMAGEEAYTEASSIADQQQKIADAYHAGESYKGGAIALIGQDHPDNVAQLRQMGQQALDNNRVDGPSSPEGFTDN